MANKRKKDVAAFLDAQIRWYEEKHPGCTVEITRQHTGNEETDIVWFVGMQIGADDGVNLPDYPCGSGETIEQAYEAMLKNRRIESDEYDELDEGSC